jgi:elongation factor P
VIPATQIKVGMVILFDGKPCRVTSVLHVTPGNWRGMVHAKMVNLVTGSQVENRFRSEDKVDRADLDHHPLQYLYSSCDEFTFMNTENYEMVNVPRDHLGEAVNFLVDGMTVEMSYFEGRPVGVDVPMFVELEIVETDPVLKGATISSSPKIAKMNTGLVTKVPQHMGIGDRVKIDTRDGSFVERV